jgi:hypothetical protein
MSKLIISHWNIRCDKYVIYFYINFLSYIYIYIYIYNIIILKYTINQFNMTNIKTFIIHINSDIIIGI